MLYNMLIALHLEPLDMHQRVMAITSAPVQALFLREWVMCGELNQQKLNDPMNSWISFPMLYNLGSLNVYIFYILTLTL